MGHLVINDFEHFQFSPTGRLSCPQLDSARDSLTKAFGDYGNLNISNDIVDGAIQIGNQQQDNAPLFTPLEEISADCTLAEVDVVEPSSKRFKKAPKRKNITFSHDLVSDCNISSSQTRGDLTLLAQSVKVGKVDDDFSVSERKKQIRSQFSR